MNLDTLNAGSAFVADFLRHLQLDRVRSPHTLVAYAKDLLHWRRFLAGEIGYRVRSPGPADALLDAVDTDTVNAYLAYLTVQKYRPSTIGRKLATLRSAYRWAAAAGRVAADPCPRVKWSNAAVSLRVPDTLAEEEIAALRAAVVGNRLTAVRNRAVIEVVLATGLNRRELLSLRAGDYLAGPGTLCVVRRARPRLWDVGPAASSLTLYLHERALRLFDLPTPALWINQHGDAIDPRSLNRMLGELARAAGVRTPVNVRTLRNTHIARRLAAGESGPAVMSDLGLHTNTAARLQVSAHQRRGAA